MRAPLLRLAAVAFCCVGCESMLVVPTNEDVASWTAHRTVAAGRTISYKLPPDPEVSVYPREVASENPTSRDGQVFALVSYGYGLPPPRSVQLSVWMELRSVDGGGIQPEWTAQQFAAFYWRRIFACGQPLSPFFPKFEPRVQSELPELGDTTWYHLSYPDETLGDRISGDAYIRPISPTHVVAVSGLYFDYRAMSREGIERRRALLRRIVAEVRVEPPFGPASPAR